MIVLKPSLALPFVNRFVKLHVKLVNYNCDKAYMSYMSGSTTCQSPRLGLGGYWVGRTKKDCGNMNLT